MADEIPTPAATTLPDVAAMSYEQIQREISDTLHHAGTNEDHVYVNKLHPGHQAAVERMGRLWERATAEAPAGSGAPAATATAEQLENWLTSTPATPDAYEIELPGVLVRDAEFEGEARGLFHAAGLNQMEATVVSRAYAAVLSDPPTPERIERDRAGAEKALKAIWRAPGEYEANVGRARKVLAEAKVSPRVLEMLEVSGFGNNPYLVKALADAGKRRGL